MGVEDWSCRFIIRIIRYPNKDITHTEATFKVIPSDVLIILMKITSRKEADSKLMVIEWYPYHSMALTKSGINFKISPSKEVLVKSR